MFSTLAAYPTTKMPRFSIIIPHYDGSVSDQQIGRCLNSLSAQSCQDFEVRLLHDGPPSRALPSPASWSFPLSVLPTELRAGDWGHSLRDRAMREAQGEYILHLNADNFLYPNALEVLDLAASAPIEPAPREDLRENPAVLVFSIVMRGRMFNGRLGFWRDKQATHRGLIYTGIPPVAEYIDCMQVVAKRSVWQAIGWWYNKSEAADGVILPAMIQRFGARYVSAVLGEHW